MSLEQSLEKIADGMGALSCGLRRLSVEVEKTNVFRLKTIHNDGGTTFDVKADQTVECVANMVWSKELSNRRDGDGSIDDPRFKIYGPPLSKPDDKYRDSKEYHQALSKYEDSVKPLLRSEKLRDIERLEPGCSLRVEYDTGVNRKTNFEIQLIKTYKVIYDDTKFPRLIPSAADKRVASLYMSNPTPSMDVDAIFPFANIAMFPPADSNRWVCLFPSSPSNGGFIGGEFRRFYDVLFMPAKSSSLFEALVVIDHTMKKYPEYLTYDNKGSQSHCRIAFPLKLTKAKEAKYNAYWNKEPHGVRDLIPNQQFNTVVGCPYKFVTRIKEGQLLKYKNILDSMFPKCSLAYGNGRWASYRNGKVIIGEGNDKGGKDRGVPKEIYDEVSYKVRSLYEFLCVCEALF
ncbi:MAG: hypothetical protein ACI90V_012389 [Bacillariaceae sp.]|jgi:hypothetical protein